MEKKLEHCRIQNWYPRLSVYSLPTNFVFLMDIEIQALQNGDTESGIAKTMCPHIRPSCHISRSLNVFIVESYEGENRK